MGNTVEVLGRGSTRSLACKYVTLSGFCALVGGLLRLSILSD
jgi:hypothetical protein